MSSKYQHALVSATRAGRNTKNITNCVTTCNSPVKMSNVFILHLIFLNGSILTLQQRQVKR